MRLKALNGEVAYGNKNLSRNRTESHDQNSSRLDGFLLNHLSPGRGAAPLAFGRFIPPALEMTGKKFHHLFVSVGAFIAMTDDAFDAQGIHLLL